MKVTHISWKQFRATPIYSRAVEVWDETVVKEHERHEIEGKKDENGDPYYYTVEQIHNSKPFISMDTNIFVRIEGLTWVLWKAPIEEWHEVFLDENNDFLLEEFFG
jgi:hypothetical protein